ncbi:MAG TPA: FAD binding domain-containing protein [Candidatus Limnocylindrales bacterium]|nr:FAD binding domain-containing protein [Candidatus Limnocylindrales bacterium]
MPRTLDEALEMKAARHDAVPLAGGTDLMVELNFGRLRPPAILDVSRLPELRSIARRDGACVLGAGVPYSRITSDLREFVPLVQASRSVGSPQIRNRGTVGGNLGTASPAGDALPVLAAYGAAVILGSVRGTRTLPWHEFLRAPKKTAIAPDELIVSATWRTSRMTGSFSKIGTRNAMVIAVASLCLVIDEDARQVRVALGSVGPTILEAPDAQASMGAAMTAAGAWEDPMVTIPQAAIDDFGERVAGAAQAIDDVRGTAAYRRHALTVMARRALGWALSDRRRARWW